MKLTGYLSIQMPACSPDAGCSITQVAHVAMKSRPYLAIEIERAGRSPVTVI